MELRRHQRLTAIYTMLERMQQAELRLAQAAVARVAAQTEVMRSEQLAAAVAQRAGRGEEVAAAGTTFAYAGAMLARLEIVRAETVSVRAAAESAYAASRLQLEQMKAIEAEARRAAQAEQDRRLQLEVDDRFGGQRFSKGEAKTR